MTLTAKKIYFDLKGRLDLEKKNFLRTDGYTKTIVRNLTKIQKKLFFKHNYRKG